MKKIFISMLLVLGFGLVSCSANDNTPEGVIVAFFKAIQKGDLKKAESYLDEKSFKAIEEPLSEMTGQNYNYLKRAATNIEQWTIRAEKYEGNIYRYYLQNPTAKSERNRAGEVFHTFTVGKINNKWKIVGPY